MEEKKKAFVVWVKEHKKQLFFTGISFTSILGVIFALKDKETILSLWKYLEDIITKEPQKLPNDINVTQVTATSFRKEGSVRSYKSPEEAFDVSQHIRNLSNGRHHSAEKAVEAAELGISLSPNQTIVDKYTKYTA